MSSFEIKGIGRTYNTTSIRKTKRKIRYSIAAVGLVILLTAFTFYQSHNKTQAYEDFKLSLSTSDYTSALIHLEAFDSVFSSKYSSYNAKNSEQLPSAEERKEFIVNLLKALELFKNDNNLEAIRKLKSLGNKVNKISAGVNNNRSKFYTLYYKQLNQIINIYKAMRKKELLTPVIVKENQNRMYQQSILSQDVANEFGLLMSLAPESPKKQGESIQFYKEGILSGLPKLKRLRDGIMDLRELRDELKIAGGEVKVSGGKTTPDLFLDKISDLKKKCSVFDVQISDLTEENKRMKEELKKLKIDYDKRLKGLYKAFNEYVIMYVSP